MHEDRLKLLKAGFSLYRCDVQNKVINRLSTPGNTWLLEWRCSTQIEFRRYRAALLKEPRSIQD